MAKDSALDAGGYARLDISDLLSDEEWEDEKGFSASSTSSCDWCAESRRIGEYLIVADNRHYEVCPTCWGRSPGYVELRRAGIQHEAALGKLGVHPDTPRG